MAKKILKLTLPLIIISWCFISDAFAGGLVPAKYAGEFMATGVGARSLGMGGAFVAVAEDVTASYWNPAGLVHLNYPQIAAMHAARFANIVKYDYASFALPWGNKESLGISLIRLGVDDIPVTVLRNPSLPVGAKYFDEEVGQEVKNTPFVLKTINDAEYALYLSYAKSRNEKVWYGGNVKLVRKGVGEYSAWGIGFDVALLVNPFANLNLGVNFQDVTTTLLAWDTGRRELITPTLKTGLAYSWRSTKIAGRLIPALDMDVRFENRRYSAQYNLGRVSFDLHFGLEYQFQKVLALRVGSDVGRLSAGVGIKLPQLNLDYAFVSHDELGDTHRISVMLTIEEERFIRKSH